MRKIFQKVTYTNRTICADKNANRYLHRSKSRPKQSFAIANKKKLSKIDDAAGYELREMDIAMASETYIKIDQIGQMIATECEQTSITAESIYMDKILS